MKGFEPVNYPDPYSIINLACPIILSAALNLLL